MLRLPALPLALLLILAPVAHAVLAPVSVSVADPVPAVTPSLGDAVDEMAALLGVEVATDSLADAVLFPALEAALAGALVGLAECTRITQAAPVPEMLAAVAAGLVPATPWAPAMRACGERVVASVDSISLALDVAAGVQFSSDPIDLWPVLVYAPGDGDDTYTDDYALIVDEGGNDAYYNNAGGSVLEIIDDRPPIDGVPDQGCHAVIDAAQGQCILAAAAMLDKAGNDVYGRLEAPTRDAVCTNDPIVLRFGNQGSGIASVGVLVDEAGDDTYIGKTLAQGTGHGGGFGYLREEAGNDSYLAIRSSQGAAVIGGTGVFHELAGDDHYDVYSPAAIDPLARIYQVGSGGVLNDRGYCDHIPRHTLGVGATGGTAYFREEAGNDHYISGWHGQGGGFNGFGFFEDLAGQDTYDGPPGRADGATVLPSASSSGLFIDHE